MMSLGLHLRVIGRPGRIGYLERFIEHVRRHDHVWIATRREIAEHFSDLRSFSRRSCGRWTMSTEADDSAIGEAEERQMLDAIERWLEREVRPKVLELEHGDVYPAEMVEQMKALGLFGATISPDYGGLGLSARTYARIVMMISEVWMSLTGIFNSHLIMAAAVQRFGTDEQKETFLPRFATGEVRGGLALTEPDCGTDLQAIRTRAVHGRRPLHRQRHQDLDLQRHRRLLLRPSGQNRPRRRAPAQGHVDVPRRKGRRFSREPQARKDGLSRHRFRRADLRGLSRSPPTS